MYRQRFSAPAVVACSAGAAFLAGLAVQRRMKSPGLVDGAQANRTSASLPGVRSQVPSVVRVRYRDADGNARYARLDEAQLNSVVERQLVELDAERKRLLGCAHSFLQVELTKAMQNLDQEAGAGSERVGAFADWYFAYTTSYKLLQVATSAAAMAAAGSALGSNSPDDTTSRAAASSAVAAAITEKYEALCLRPPLLGPALRRAFVNAAEQTHAEFLTGVERIRVGAQALLEDHTDHARPPGAKGGLSAAFDRPDLGLTATFLAVGVAASKLVAPKAVAASAGQALGGAASKILAAKLASPFVAKAIGSTVSVVAAGSTAAAAALSGPAGAVVGAAVGLGIDYTLNATMKHRQRDVFIRDVCDAIASARQDWEEAMEIELARVVDVWIDDAKQLSAAYPLLTEPEQ